jgi:hypothetical protein
MTSSFDEVFCFDTTPKKFVLSKLSLGRLNGVDANLVKVVKRAIEITHKILWWLKVCVQKSNAISTMVKVAQLHNVQRKVFLLNTPNPNLPK